MHRNSGSLFENVEVLETVDANEWSSIVESELKKPLDLIDGPLWRLKVVKLSTQSAAHFVFTFHHAITDGRNSCICIRLLDICAALIDERHCEEMTDTIIPTQYCVEDMVATYAANGQLKHDPLLKRDDEEDAELRVPQKVGNLANLVLAAGIRW